MEPRTATVFNPPWSPLDLDNLKFEVVVQLQRRNRGPGKKASKIDIESK